MKKHVFLSCICLLFIAYATPIFANDCNLEITGNDQMKFNLSEMTVDTSKCKKVTITLKHVGKLQEQVMGHNWVLTKSSDMQEVGQEGMKAGADAGYLPKDRSKIIAATDMIGGGETTSVTFEANKLTKGGDYSFFCSFPGHMALMKGKLIVK